MRHFSSLITSTFATFSLFVSPSFAFTALGPTATSVALTADRTDGTTESVLLQKSLDSYNSKVLSLQECLKIALKNNPQLISNFNLIQQSEWNLVSSRRQWFPTFNFNSTLYGAQQSLQKSLINSGGSTSTFLNSGQAYNAYQQSLPAINLSWYFINPTIQPSINSALAKLKSQRFTYDYIARGLVLQVQTAYINVQAAQSLINAYRKIYYTNKQQVDYLNAQLSKGMIDLGALQQAKTQMYQQLAILIQYQQQLASQASLLAQLLGYTDKLLILPSQPLDSHDQWDLPLGDTIENARLFREEIKAYLQTADSFRWNARQLLNTYLPSFYLGSTATGSYQAGCLNVFSINQCPNIPSTNSMVSTSVNVGITWQFDGGLNAATANANKAAEESNKNLALNAETLAVQQVKTSFAQYENYKLAVKVANKQLSSAELSAKVSAERFRVGVGDITTLVQSQQLLSSAVQTQVQALQQYNIAIAQLYRYSAQLPPVTPYAVMAASSSN
jgi:outer membrane protein TolC